MMGRRVLAVRSGFRVASPWGGFRSNPRGRNLCDPTGLHLYDTEWGRGNPDIPGPRAGYFRSRFPRHHRSNLREPSNCHRQRYRREYSGKDIGDGADAVVFQIHDLQVCEAATGGHESKMRAILHIKGRRQLKGSLVICIRLSSAKRYSKISELKLAK